MTNFEKIVKTINFQTGKAIDNLAAWCEDHQEGIKNVFLHVILPAGVGYFLGIKAASGSEQQVLYLIMNSEQDLA